MSCFGLALNDYAKINQLKSNNEENARKRHKGKLSGGARESRERKGEGEKGICNKCLQRKTGCLCMKETNPSPW